jgi:hemin uptake protein HemP
MDTVIEPFRLSRMNEPSRPPTEAPLRAPETDPKQTAEPVTIRSEDLLQGASEVRILHGNDVYRLRLTHNGRLILSK